MASAGIAPNVDKFLKIQPLGTSKRLAICLKTPPPKGAAVLAEAVDPYADHFGHLVCMKTGQYAIWQATGGLKSVDQRRAALALASLDRQLLEDHIDPDPTAAFKACREETGLNQADWAFALGYRNRDRQGARQQVNDMEGGRKPITPQVARLAEMYRRYGIPEEFLLRPSEDAEEIE